MIDLVPWTPTPSVALAVLLVAGHFLADFLFQTQEDVEAKRRGTGFIRHGLIVFTIQAALVVPLWSGAVFMATVAVTLVHLLIDWGKSRYLSSATTQLTAFTVDQAAHLLAIAGVWCAVVSWAPPTVLPTMDPSSLGTFAVAALLAAAFAFNGTGGSVIVEAVLRRVDVAEGGPQEAGGLAGAGRLIGILERTLVLALVLYQQWAAVAILVTAKSVARFEELKMRPFAEYYLVGTLTSLLVALGVAVVLTEIVSPILV